jgi:hypothetical protein
MAPLKMGKTSRTYGTERELTETLRQCRHHDQRQWVFIPRLRVGAGFGNVLRLEGRTLAEQVPNPLERVEQTVDAWAMDLWPSHNFKKIAYEVKVSRADFFHELENPQKREAAVLLSNQFYFVVPTGLVSPLEVPEGCGLIYVGDSRCHTVKESARHQGPEPTWSFISSVLRRGLEEPQEYLEMADA